MTMAKAGIKLSFGKRHRYLQSRGSFSRSYGRHILICRIPAIEPIFTEGPGISNYMVKSATPFILVWGNPWLAFLPGLVPFLEGADEAAIFSVREFHCNFCIPLTHSWCSRSPGSYSGIFIPVAASIQTATIRR